MAYKVFLGVGHGGSDPGAVANGFKESALNLSIAMACQDELARHGVLVKMSRTKDESESVASKVNECNAFAPDLALDIHNNAGGGDGAEVFYSVYGGTGKALAVNILDEVVKIGQNSRGAKTKTNSSGSDYFGFIRTTKAPAVIVECAFVDNKTDMQILDTKAEQIAMGQAIAKGILRSLGVAYKPEESKAAQTTTGTLYRVQVGAYGVRANAEAMQQKLKAAGYDAIIVEVKK
jgi:N-acetylmuramoyl-L-alanine amidase